MASEHSLYITTRFLSIIALISVLGARGEEAGKRGRMPVQRGECRVMCLA
jgi:hypothetical protein